MKKLFFLFIIFFSITLLGCKANNPKYIHFEKKPKLNYYTCEIGKLLLSKNDYSLELYNTNLCTSTTLNNDDKKILINFINSAKNENYISEEELEKISDEISYELKVKFESGEIFIIKIFSPSLVSINPWDGIFSEDYIKTDTLPTKYNPYNFCTFIENRQKNNYKD